MKRRPSTPAGKLTSTPTPSKKRDRVVTARSVEARHQEIHEAFLRQRKDPNPQRLYFSYERLAAEVGRSKRTVQRDVEYMRDTRRLPIDYFPERQGWGYTEDVAALPSSGFSEGELTAICFAMRALEGIQRIPFLGKVRQAVKKLATTLRAELKLDFEKLEKSVSFRTIGLDAFIDPAIFELVIEAVLNREELDIDYAKLNWPDDAPTSSLSSSSSSSSPRPTGTPAPQEFPPSISNPAQAAVPESASGRIAKRSRRLPSGSGYAGAFTLRSNRPETKPKRKAPNILANHQSQFTNHSPSPSSPSAATINDPQSTNHFPPARTERRRVEPLHLLCMDQVWYLFAYDPMRKGIRSFALTRMRDVRRTGRIGPKRAFDLDQELAPSFGITSGKAVDVSVRFRGKAARLVCERLWHPSQELAHQSDGSVKIHFHVADTPELKRWVLGWGASAEVLEPSDLRTAICSAAHSILAQD